MLPTTLKGALESPNISDVVRSCGKETVRLLIEFEIVKLATSINVGGNLNEEQVKDLAADLLELYPMENIADFRACFHRAVMQRAYGDIYRLDAMVVAGWMAQYMEEKYAELEAELYRQKDATYEPPKKSESDPNFNLVEEFKKIHGDVVQKIPKMLPKMIEFHGQETPPEMTWTGHRNMSPEEVEAWHADKAKRLEAAKSARLAELREKHPTLTIEELNRLL